MKKKKLLFLGILSLISAMGLVACGGNSSSSSTNTSPTTTSTTPSTTTSSTSTTDRIAIVKECVTRLIAVETTTAYDYLPDAMHPAYRNNVVTEESIDYDFSSFRSVSSLNHAGYGEQWQMVISNINQSVMMAKVLNVVQTVLTLAGNAIDIYIDNSFAEEMNYQFSGENYSAIFTFKNSVLTLTVNLSKTYNIPGIGEFRPIVRMEYNLNREAKAVFISLGDVYKLKYVITNNQYEMATTYGVTVSGNTASRASYLSIAKSNTKTTGHIYEYTTFNGFDMLKACADFYVENGYVSVVGNKADDMIAFKGYINELYRANEGRLIGYEVREELSAVQYNTLWFNLWDISGINNIKIGEKTDLGLYDKREIDVYLNNSSSLFEPTYNTEFSIRTSRKYDIELRSRFYYTYDSENDKYVANEVKIPMMFIQEDNSVDSNFTDYPADMLRDNGINSSVILDRTYLNKIMSDYDTLIDIFIQNKDSMSSEAIIEYLEQYEN